MPVQRLIRTRRAGRLSERLTRRLMRDLAAGLKFLWSQELIHRDIKPQNLLLTGPLPLDERNDPAKMAIHDEMREKENFPSAQFALKIADFGFARHLQTTSLAETLCGSPLYMAPEILQHQRYDAKADLWSVGTVLFEMIAGKPPFNGENHIDLLRNIQRKAVRLPTDVRVSMECVNLLRILLNRNPLSRAGFSQFLEACSAFVKLGCEGVPLQQQQDQQVSRQSSIKTMDLGTIHEDNKGATTGSMMTVATLEGKPLQQNQNQQSRTNNERALTRSPSSAQQHHQQGYVTPPFGPLPTPQLSRPMSPLEKQLTTATQQLLQPQTHYQSINPRFAPLQPSPPQSGICQLIPPSAPVVLNSPSIPNLDATSINRHGQIQLTTFHHRSSPMESASQNSSDDSEFVMVEHHASRHSKIYGHNNGTGILSTSPGTGGMLVGLMKMGSRSRLVHRNNSPGGSSGTNVVTSNPSPVSSIDSEIESATKMVAASEDVGRRAISVAHLGDTRAYLSMQHLVNLANSSGSSLLSAAMEGAEEEGKSDGGDEYSAANVTDYGEDEASSHSKSTTNRRRLSSASDKIMMMELAKVNDENDNDDDHDDEMPFAMPAADECGKISSVPIPSRPGSESYYNKKSTNIVPSVAKSSPHLVRVCLREALSCYLKALSMIKSVLNAVQKAREDLEGLKQQQQQGGIGGALNPMMVMTPDRASSINRLLTRCNMTGKWLSGQFTGVLERADAANTEINKLSPPSTVAAEKSPKNRSNDDKNKKPASVNELIYNHALACGRDAAVKQLLGQYNPSRSCYRTAGLLVEVLLMEPNIGADDKRILTGYVNGFSTRIHKLDTLIRQEAASPQQSPSTGQHHLNSELIGSSIGTSNKGRSGGVIGIIGGSIPPILTEKLSTQ